MQTFLSAYIQGEPFILFSPMHFSALGIVLLANLMLCLWFKYACRSRGVQYFRYWLAGAMLANELCYILWSVYAGVWSPKNSLPLQLCEAATFLSAFMLLKKSYAGFEIAYFWALGGSLQALLTPELYYPFPHCMFFIFFFAHGALLTGIFYMMITQRFYPTNKSLWKTFCITNLYMGAIAVVNLLTDGNYMFLARKPENASILDFLGPWPWYLVSLEAVGPLLCLLLLAPFALLKQLHKYTHGKHMAIYNPNTLGYNINTYKNKNRGESI